MSALCFFGTDWREKSSRPFTISLLRIVFLTITSRFSRQSVPKKHNADINKILKNGIEVVASQLLLKKIELDAHFDPSLPEVKVKANQIQQVIINLLVNAADAIGDN